MKFYFFYKRVGDVDHLCPVIYSLLEKGVESKDIYFYDLWPDKTQKNLNTDPRIKFLQNLQINIIQSRINHIYALIASWIIRPLPIPIFGKVLRRIFYLKVIQGFFERCLFVYLRKKLKALGRSLDREDIFLIDQGTSSAHIEVINFAKENEIKCYALPHGVITHRGLKDQEINTNSFGKNTVKGFTKVIFPNQLASKLSGLDSSDMEVLGSARFSKKWVYKLKEIYKPVNFLTKEKVNILLLAEKDGIKVDGKFIPSIYKEEIKKTISLLTNFKEVNLVIKHHPSRTGPFGAPDLGPYKSKKALNILEDEKASTFQLINECDVVIATFSSAIIDALILKKKIFILQYTSPYQLVFEEHIKNCTINNLEELKYSINQILIKNFEIDQDGYKKFIKHNVEWTQSCLDEYAEFLTKDMN